MFVNERSKYPFLSGTSRVFLDNAATVCMPQPVIDRVCTFYAHERAPVYRGIYDEAEHATHLYEDARTACAKLLGARDRSEIVFTPGATYAANAVAFGWGLHALKPGDEIIISDLDHHAHVVVWYEIARRTGARVRRWRCTKSGTLDIQHLDALLGPATKLVACPAASNVTGHHIAVRHVCERAQAWGAVVAVDAAQAVPHVPVNVCQWGADFVYFSGHKMGAPVGGGVLYVAQERHSQMRPYVYGGGMVLSTADSSGIRYRDMPALLEAGSPACAPVVGLHAAYAYLSENDHYTLWPCRAAMLCARFIKRLQKHASITILGDPQELAERGHLVSFVVAGIHAHDVVQYAHAYNIALRSGHHCAQPLHEALGVNASVRMSVWRYTTPEEIDYCADVIDQMLQEHGS